MLPLPASAAAPGCIEWIDSTCVLSDGAFDLDLAELASTSTGRELLELAEGVQVAVRRASPDARFVASFVPSEHTVWIARTVEHYPAAARLAILTHELQHAADAARGLPMRTAAECYATEQRAVEAQTRLWRELFEEDLPAPQTAYEAWLNSATRSPGGMRDLVESAYRSECERGN